MNLGLLSGSAGRLFGAAPLFGFLVITVLLAAVGGWWSGRWTMATRQKVLVALAVVLLLEALASFWMRLCPSTANKDSRQQSPPLQSQ